MIIPQQKNQIDVQEVRRICPTFIKKGQAIEIRALNATLHGDRLPYEKPRVIAGWFNDTEALVSSVQQITSAEGIYITINPCEPALLARANNRLKDKKVTATTDQQITGRQYLLLDVDPEREGHVTGIPTNDREHQIALGFVQAVCDELKGEGWPDAIRFDSGNGGYALFAINLPADDNGLIERVLKGIAQRFDTEQVHIDQTTFNQSRIMRLPGTWNCKGDGTEDRPHRTSKILSIPDKIRPVPVELLEAIATPVEQERPKQEQKTGNKGTSYKKDKQPPDYLDEWNVRYGPQRPYNGGWKWQLEECPFCHNSDHNAFVYVASSNEFGFKCSHNSCKGLHWRDLRLRFDDAYAKRDPWSSIAPYSPSQAYPSNGNGYVKTYHNGQEYIPPCKKHVFAAKEVPTKDIQDYMDMQQLGDGQLFARCFEGQVAYDSFEKEWYLWQGHHWRRDMHDHIRVLVSGHLGSVYLRATAPLNDERAQIGKELEELGSDDQAKADELKKRIKEIDALIKAFIQRAKDLRKRSYNTGVLYFAESLLAIPTHDDGTSLWDSLTGKIGVKNGVLDLRTGICRDGEPSDYIRTFSPTEWRGLNAQCPLFLKFLDELFELREDKEEVIQFLIRLLGYSLTGVCKEAIFAILYGPEGRNGKSTLFKIIMACIGKALVGSIAKELLIDTGKSQHANGPKPDELDLQGKRIAIASETEKGAKLNVSAIKRYTGGDELGGRPVFGKHNVRFEQTHTLFLHTNFKPHADPGDSAFWARACLIEFNMRFIEDPDPNKPNERKYDTGLERRIIEEELSGVLACLIRGAMDYDNNGLKKPQSVKLDSEAYRVSEDTLQTFINECCTLGIGKEYSTLSSAFIKAYGEWSGDGFKLTSKELKKQMEKKGFKLRHTNQGSVYDGIKFVGEGRDPSDSKSGGMTGSDSSEKTCQLALEAGSDGSSDRSDSSLCKVPHEDSNKSADTKLSQSAVTPVTLDNINRLEKAPQADSQCGDRKKSAVTPENLLSPSSPDAIPEEHRILFDEYRQKVLSNPVATLIWCAQDSGYKNGIFGREDHIKHTSSLLRSGEERKEKGAVEAMKRTLGTWED